MYRQCSSRKILACLDHDTAIVITLLDTGLRLSELTNLKMTDAQIDQGYLKVMGKGSKECIVPIGGLARARAHGKRLGRPPGSKDRRRRRKQPIPRYPIWWN